MTKQEKNTATFTVNGLHPCDRYDIANQIKYKSQVQQLMDFGKNSQ